jgi:hypothetical protein
MIIFFGLQFYHVQLMWETCSITLVYGRRCQTLPHKLLYILYFCRRSPGLPLLVDKIAFCRVFREHRCHDITRLYIYIYLFIYLFKDAQNCSLHTVSDRLLNEHEALLE